MENPHPKPNAPSLPRLTGDDSHKEGGALYYRFAILGERDRRILTKI